MLIVLEAAFSIRVIDCLESHSLHFDTGSVIIIHFKKSGH
jgi:hypothetical protein